MQHGRYSKAVKNKPQQRGLTDLTIEIDFLRKYTLVVNLIASSIHPFSMDFGKGQQMDILQKSIPLCCWNASHAQARCDAMDEGACLRGIE